MAAGRPVADVSTSGWTNLKGSVLNLYKNVDDPIESATDAVTATMPSNPFNPSGTLSGESSRATYTTAGGTACKNIIAHALSINDDYHKVRFIVPNAADLAQLTPIVFVLHGVGTSGEDIITTGGFGTNGMTDAALDLGWPVLSAQEGGDSWGNDSARSGFLDIWSWISGIFNCPGFLVYGISMGACGALNYLLDVKTNALPILCCATNSGATNVQYTYDHNSSLKTSIQTAYGLGSVSSADPTYVAAIDTDNGGHDPQKQTAAEFPTIPFRFYVGNADLTISKANNTDLFAAKLAAASWPLEAAEVVYSGDHVANASYQPSDWTAFCQRSIET